MGQSHEGGTRMTGLLNHTTTMTAYTTNWRTQVHSHGR